MQFLISPLTISCEPSTWEPGTRPWADWIDVASLHKQSTRKLHPPPHGNQRPRRRAQLTRIFPRHGAALNGRGQRRKWREGRRRGRRLFAGQRKEETKVVKFLAKANKCQIHTVMRNLGTYVKRPATQHNGPNTTVNHSHPQQHPRLLSTWSRLHRSEPPLNAHNRP